jgi:hypothetical protein
MEDPQMLSTVQYSPQGLVPLFPGFMGMGLPQTGPSPFVSPGAFGGIQTPYPFAASPYLANPFLQNSVTPWGATPFVNGAVPGAFGPHLSALQIIPLLGQIAQQIAVQSAVAQQTCIALYQLAQQLTTQSLQTHPVLDAGNSFAGQPFGIGAPFAGIGVGQPFAQGPFAGVPQGGYGGLTAQTPLWATNRTQSIN